MRNVKRRRKKLHSLSVYVIFSIAMLLIYTIAELILAHVTGTTDDTLTSFFFGVFGGEILTCALIKIFKLKESKNE